MGFPQQLNFPGFCYSICKLVLGKSFIVQQCFKKSSSVQNFSFINLPHIYVVNYFRKKYFLKITFVK
jgi:hypothetical protein